MECNISDSYLHPHNRIRKVWWKIVRIPRRSRVKIWLFGMKGFFSMDWIPKWHSECDFPSHNHDSIEVDDQRPLLLCAFFGYCCQVCAHSEATGLLFNMRSNVLPQDLIEGILPKGPYLLCVIMAGRALLTRYHRYEVSKTRDRVI